MSNAAILYDNIADAGSVSASSWVAAAPPSFLQNIHVTRRWKGASGEAEWIILDLLEAKTFDEVCLFGCEAIGSDNTQVPMDSNAITQVTASLTDSAVLSDIVYDSGSAAGRISDKYSALAVHLPNPITARYVRIDITQPSALSLLAGRLVVGSRNQFTFNFSYGWGFGYADLSRIKKSSGGQTFIDHNDRYRVLNLSFGALTEADRYDFVDEADRLNGISSDVLFIINPSSTQPDRDTIWGLMRDLSPPTQPNTAHFSKSYQIEERR